MTLPRVVVMSLDAPINSTLNHFRHLGLNIRESLVMASHAIPSLPRPQFPGQGKGPENEVKTAARRERNLAKFKSQFFTKPCGCYLKSL